MMFVARFRTEMIVTEMLICNVMTIVDWGNNKDPQELDKNFLKEEWVLLLKQGLLLIQLGCLSSVALSKYFRHNINSFVIIDMFQCNTHDVGNTFKGQGKACHFMYHTILTG